MTGTLKAKVGGNWVPILGSGQDAANTAGWWNTAWGIVAVGSLAVGNPISLPANTDVQVTGNLPFTMLVGRRYRVSLSMRAVTTQVGTSSTFLYLRLRDGSTNLFASEPTPASPGNYGAVHYQWLFDGDGVTRSFNVSVNSYSIASNLYGTSPSFFYIEDMGPVIPASVAPPTAGARVVASGNALGIVAVGAMQNESPTVINPGVTGNITKDLSVFLSVGRRYRVAFATRAVQMQSGSAVSFEYRLSLNPNMPFGQRYFYLGGLYQRLADEWIIDGDGAQHTLNVIVIPPTSPVPIGIGVYTESYASHFYVEDMGPNTSPALPIPATPPAWTPVTFQSGWSNLGGGFQTVQYRRIGDVVQTRGIAGVVSPPTGTWTVFTLPVGFRPPASLVFASIAGDALARVNVDSNGAVYPSGIGGQPGTWYSYFSIDFSFSTTA